MDRLMGSSTIPYMTKNNQLYTLKGSCISLYTIDTELYIVVDLYNPYISLI